MRWLGITRKLAMTERTFEELTDEEKYLMLAKEAEEKGNYVEASVYYVKAGYQTKANACIAASLFVQPERKGN